MYMKNHVMVGPDKPVIPGQRCFEQVSSQQQGICITCLAHHLALYTRGEPECLCMYIHMYLGVISCSGNELTLLINCNLVDHLAVLCIIQNITASIHVLCTVQVQCKYTCTQNLDSDHPKIFLYKAQIGTCTMYNIAKDFLAQSMDLR